MFYDLNLAIDGLGEQSRRELVAMAMQLGYSGVAANHNLTGIMVDSDRCRIYPLELKTILSAGPAVADSARFHRELLGVPHGCPFRQFTRITVVVENPTQANALNTGNPVLQTYDIVAVRPTNQKAFNQACSHSEVCWNSKTTLSRLRIFTSCLTLLKILRFVTVCFSCLKFKCLEILEKYYSILLSHSFSVYCIREAMKSFNI
jgi:hypothetical protein